MIREVQLSNFMSYKKAIVPLEPGLNLIIGPNGAGKSSILLGISVVLGQAYTERAKRLSELIRWGEPEARVSVRLDNIDAKGLKPFPQARGNEVLITRVLKRTGDYHYLLNNKPVSKTDVVEGLLRIGLNPDNMLVIMHQLMVGRFGSVNPVDKLLMLEDAIGFGDYRREVLDSSSRLQKLTTEREAMSSVLEGTKETYQHWQREFEKYELKRKLETQHRDLQRELAWRKILRKETSQTRVKDRISSLQRQSGKAKKEFDSHNQESIKLSSELSRQEEQVQSYREQFSKLEYGRGFRSGATEWIAKIGHVVESQEKLIRSLTSTSQVSGELLENARLLEDALSNYREEQEKMSLTATAEEAEYEKLGGKVRELSASLGKSTEAFIQSRVGKEVSSFKLSIISDQIQDMEAQLRLVDEELEPLRAQASQLGPTFENPRDLQNIMVDLATVEEKLKPLAHLSEDVEKMFHNYGTIYEDLKKKALVVEQNRTEVLSELRERFERWRGLMEKMLEDLSERYNSILAPVGGTGRIVLKATKEIEKAGLELHAGFRGNEPVSLDGLSPSGGERTIALIGFLLSLQQFVASPFRAIDEFDVHMDPRNRETITKLIYAASAESEASQYVAITPGHLTLPGNEHVHVVVVQNIEGSSTVKELTQK